MQPVLVPLQLTGQTLTSFIVDLQKHPGGTLKTLSGNSRQLTEFIKSSSDFPRNHRRPWYETCCSGTTRPHAAKGTHCPSFKAVMSACLAPSLKCLQPLPHAFILTNSLPDASPASSHHLASKPMSYVLGVCYDSTPFQEPHYTLVRIMHNNLPKLGV